MRQPNKIYGPGGVMRGCGRASRQRKKKHGSVVRSVSLSHQHQCVRLLRFLHQRGLTPTLLRPAVFSGTHTRTFNSVVHTCHVCASLVSPDTGRGLQAVRNVKPGQLLISLPQSCLLTTSTVMDSYLGQYIKSWKTRPSPLLVLCVFLVCERHRGEYSDWFPYMDILPATYSCPAYFSDDVMALLPSGVQRRALEQREAVRELHSSNQDLFQTLQPLLSHPAADVLTYEALRWAWCSVNTRSVFMPQPSNEFLHGQDVYALAPFLDFLNHQPDVQVKAGFNPSTKCYEIRSVCGTQRFQQAFINYGSHDNQRLLLEYGFVAPGNPHSVVYVDTETLRQVLRGDRSLEQKMKFLREKNFHNNLTISSEGPSWRLMTTLRLMSLPQTQYHQWGAVLRGQAVDEEADLWSVRTAMTLCERLLLNTLRALHQISRLLQQGEELKEQLQVVESLRVEEKCILGSCLESLRQSLGDASVSSNQRDTNYAS
ncbi:SET domain-containing protein 4 isoform X2 [Dunckerocampus dactyliophorus]|uniref:SET domain-containing protein 4 isoform X2 n=1 Tax=Dunckerocampus dactyliophorus TaxID=161453 RepID=UPI0024058E70|nr:SET domain-containing protein 4 isoform X2 [Dunckerocampus dactyliophorus]